MWDAMRGVWVAHDDFALTCFERHFDVQIPGKHYRDLKKPCTQEIYDELYKFKYWFRSFIRDTLLQNYKLREKKWGRLQPIKQTRKQTQRACHRAVYAHPQRPLGGEGLTGPTNTLTSPRKWLPWATV